MEIHVIPGESRLDARHVADQMMRSLMIGERPGTYLNNAYRFARTESRGIIRLGVKFNREEIGMLTLVFNNQKEIISVSFNPSSDNAARRLPAAMRTFLERIREIAHQDNSARRPFSQPPPHWHSPPGHGGRIRNASQLRHIA